MLEGGVPGENLKAESRRLNKLTKLLDALLRKAQREGFRNAGVFGLFSIETTLEFFRDWGS